MTEKTSKTKTPILAEAPGTLEWLIAIVQRLLAPDGCPWDRKQTLESLRRYLLEECYEVIDAIDAGDPAHHCEELGDLLFQIVFQSEIGNIPMPDVIESIGTKLIRRHPHVFGDASVANADEVVVNWERLKAAEHASDRQGALAGVPRAMPALQRGTQLVERAARAGFRWPNPQSARAKIAEELAEADDAIAASDDARAKSELGDVLLAIIGWAQTLGLDSEEALREAVDRFEGRFGRMEQAITDADKAIADCSIEELLDRWNRAR